MKRGLLYLLCRFLMVLLCRRFMIFSVSFSVTKLDDSKPFFICTVWPGERGGSLSSFLRCDTGDRILACSRICICLICSSWWARKASLTLLVYMGKISAMFLRIFSLLMTPVPLDMVGWFVLRGLIPFFRFWTLTLLGFGLLFSSKTIWSLM